MRYDGRDFREQPPRRKFPTSFTVSITVAITLSLVVTLVLIFRGYFFTQPGTTGASPTPTPGTTATNPPVTSTTPPACLGFNGHQISGTLSDPNVYYRIEFNTTGTWPEYESWLAPGTYSVPGNVNGFVWDFPLSCTTAQLQADAVSSHNRRMHDNPGATGSMLQPNDPIVTSSFIKQ